MKRVKYVTYLFQANATGNKLEKAILDFIQDQNKKIIQPENLENYKEQFIAKIKELNDSYPRCRPFNPSWYNFRHSSSLGDNKETDHWSLHDIHFITFALFEVEEEI